MYVRKVCLVAALAGLAWLAGATVAQEGTATSRPAASNPAGDLPAAVIKLREKMLSDCAKATEEFAAAEAKAREAYDKSVESALKKRREIEDRTKAYYIKQLDSLIAAAKEGEANALKAEKAAVESGTLGAPGGGDVTVAPTPAPSAAATEKKGKGLLMTDTLQSFHKYFTSNEADYDQKKKVIDFRDGCNNFTIESAQAWRQVSMELGMAKYDGTFSITCGSANISLDEFMNKVRPKMPVLFTLVVKYDATNKAVVVVVDNVEIKRVTVRDGGTRGLYSSFHIHGQFSIRNAYLMQEGD